MTKPKTQNPAQAEKTRLEILLERKDRHLKNVAKIEAVLARQSAFLAYGSKAKARARWKDLIARSAGSAAPSEQVLSTLGLKPATTAERHEASSIEALFAQYPWAEKDHA